METILSISQVLIHQLFPTISGVGVMIIILQISKLKQVKELESSAHSLS